jgi:flagellar motor switch protein FliM
VAAAYNFRRPDRISKEQLRSLHFLHDRFAHNVSTSLSAFLRSVTK